MMPVIGYGTRLEIKGAEEFAKQLRELGDKSARKVIRQSMKAAGLPAKNAMKRRLLGIQSSPRSSMKRAFEKLSRHIEAHESLAGASIGEKHNIRRANWLKAMRNLIQSLGIVVRTYPSGVIFSVIGPRAGHKFQREGNIFPPIMAMLIEQGSTNAPPRPFVRPALMETRGQMEAKLRDRLAKGIVREAKRLRKR